ncbi:hypothetical protein DFH08DRAFT_963678 [Mycena albidolilacea]|uniref:Uncharacterized protein n=1 Tax=Mycena albidolilacea TaxID=1033008 RepID=A0AAD6ZW54_9AGAR|nr:hypothetical protein DFH08DRAFT_963678 [Mycena albidolilacea]
MSSLSSTTPTTPPRSRGLSLGKYLRAHGQGWRRRPTEFGTQLLLEGEGLNPKEDEEQAAECVAELVQTFYRWQLGTNADQFAELEPVVDLHIAGEPEVEPKVDSSSFLKQQRISDAPGPSIQASTTDVVEDDNVSHSLAHISSSGIKPMTSRKGKVERIEWNNVLDELEHEKASAEAIWDLKTRFLAKYEKLRKLSAAAACQYRSTSSFTLLVVQSLPKGMEEDMQDFLDDLST